MVSFIGLMMINVDKFEVWNCYISRTFLTLEGFWILFLFMRFEIKVKPWRKTRISAPLRCVYCSSELVIFLNRKALRWFSNFDRFIDLTFCSLYCGGVFSSSYFFFPLLRKSFIRNDWKTLHQDYWEKKHHYLCEGWPFKIMWRQDFQNHASVHSYFH